MDSASPVHAGNFRFWLAEELRARRERAPTFSLRSFARRLGVSPAGLSQLLSGKRPLTEKMAQRIAEKLELDPNTGAQLVRAAKARKVPSRAGASRNDDFGTIDMETFEVISDWSYFAVLGLAHVEDNRFDPQWIAQRLSLPTRRAKEILSRLVRLGLVEDRDGRIVQTGKRIATPDGISSRAIRRFHRGLLSKADEALTSIPMNERDFSAMTMAISPQRLDEARELIKRFRRDLRALMETGYEQRVYALAIQFFPLDQRRTEDG